MKYEPHSYQKYATDFIERNSIAALLLDMGLGKTSITLTALNNLLFDYFECSSHFSYRTSSSSKDNMVR